MFKTCKKPPMSIISASGDICTFKALQAGIPLKSHSVAVNSVSGVSSINIWSAGKNLAPINARSQTAAGTTITVDTDGIATVENTGTASHFFEYFRGNYNFPKGTYRFTAWVNGEEYTQSGITNSPYRFYFSMTNGGVVNAGNSFTITQDTGLWIIYIQTKNGWSYDDEVKLQIEVGSTATEWEKYNATTNIINIGSTVNEGTYDAITGVLEATQPSVQTIQLPPVRVETLLGVNNIFADCGSTSIEAFQFGR